MPKHPHGSETLRQTTTHCLTEFLATALFIYIGCGACISSFYTEKADHPDLSEVDSPRLTIIAMAHGFSILLLVFATAHVSGGHINPVVSLAMIATGNIRLKKGLAYIFCQFTGGIAGALMLRASFTKDSAGSMGAHNLGNGVTPLGGIIIEFVLTFLLVYVIFSMAVNPNAPPGLAPIAIGLAVLVDHLVGVPFTGASMNPARTLAAALVSQTNFNHLYVYFIGPPLGALAAGLAYQYGVVNYTLKVQFEGKIANPSDDNNPRTNLLIN